MIWTLISFSGVIAKEKYVWGLKEQKMISNQILQNTIEGLKGIARVELCVMDVDGKEKQPPNSPCNTIDQLPWPTYLCISYMFSDHIAAFIHMKFITKLFSVYFCKYTIVQMVNVSIRRTFYLLSKHTIFTVYNYFFTRRWRIPFQ